MDLARTEHSRTGERGWYPLAWTRIRIIIRTHGMGLAGWLGSLADKAPEKGGRIAEEGPP